jgi:DNA-binding NarL/FixJ family response regulator
MSAAATPIRVFLVEDSPFVRERLAETLTAPGKVEVIGQADNETEAVAALRAAPWDALILDLELRQGSGFGVLKAIRQRRPPGAKVIVLTNYAVAPMRDASLALGADYVFDKMRDWRHVRDMLAAMATLEQPGDSDPRDA